MKGCIQGYLAHKKLLPPGTIQQDYAQGPTVVLGGGVFLMSEVPLYVGAVLVALKATLSLTQHGSTRVHECMYIYC